MNIDLETTDAALGKIKIPKKKLNVLQVGLEKIGGKKESRSLSKF